MRYCVLFVIAALALLTASCRNDFEFEPSTGDLSFSRDTVYLDTVFTNIGSSTYTLKVYNRSNKDISIPSIRLGQGEDSKYRLMVDGMPGKVFNNVELLAKDSMYIFIETTVDYSEYANDNTTFLYTDRIEFDNGSNYQKVELVTLVQDAYFLFPQRNEQGQYEAVRYDSDDNPGDPVFLRGFNLDRNDPNNGDEYRWNNTKPYVIYGIATVPDGETLTVDPGARIHFHEESGLMVRPGARLVINGAPSADPEVLENEVIFEGDRLEPDFADIAGQWFGILLMSGEENTISNLTLKNATVGIYAKAPQGDDTTIPKLTIINSQIYNNRNFGIWAVNANISGINLAANNAGVASLACTLGGTYSFKHCTFANYFNNFNQVPVALNDYEERPDAVYIAAMDAQFDNCIMYGSGNLGLSSERRAEEPFSTRFNNCLIKIVDSANRLRNNSLYPFDGNVPELAAYNDGCIIANGFSITPDFTAPFDNVLTLGEDSDAIDAAVNIGIGTDITSTVRPNPSTGIPDIGAYEYYAAE